MLCKCILSHTIAYILYIHIAIYIICIYIHTYNMLTYYGYNDLQLLHVHVHTTRSVEDGGAVRMYVRKYVYCLICHHWSMDG